MRRVFVGLLGLAVLAGGGGLSGCGARVVESGVRDSEVVPVSREPDPDVPSTTQVTMPPAECSADGIRFAVVSGDAAMGIRVVSFQLVNCGTTPYTVSGYPEVRLYDEDHQPVTVSVEHGDGTIATVPDFDNPPGEVTLRPGEWATSGFLWRNLVTDSDLTKSVTAYYVEAAAGAGKPWLDMPMVMPDDVTGARQVTIDLGNTGKLGVQAWHKA